MDYNIYYILAGLAVVYIFLSIFNKRNAKRRKSKKFMEGYERKDKKKED